MTFELFAAQALLAMSAFLGVTSMPDPAGSGWTVESPWSERDGHMAFEASSTQVTDECRRTPSASLHFPMVIQGVQTISLDGQPILEAGDPTFKTTSATFYGSPTIACSRLASGQKVTWQIRSFAKYFARIDEFPHPQTSISAHNLFAETIHIVGAGGMLALALFTFVIFFNRVSPALTLSISGSCLGASVYFAAVCSIHFGIQWPMLLAHRVADLGVWAAVLLLINSLRLEGLVPRSYFIFYALNVAIGTTIIVFGADGDAIQLGTSFPFVSVVPLLILLLWRMSRRSDQGWHRRRVLYALTLFTFIAACMNEMVVVTGLVKSFPVFPIGFLCGITFFAFALNERIAETYRERDYLRDNLEAEVRHKTQELRAAMDTLRSTQAELVQSAKLASLGTLSAGIAHEINNSLNYVNGAMQPLEKIIEKSARPEDRPKIDKLLVVMKEGLQLTLEIIKSLRSHTGLNQAKFNDVRLREAAASSLAILRTRTRGKIEIDLQVPETLKAFGSVVGLNQVFMNLISNAIDAMPNGGRLSIEGEENDGQAVVRVRDTGGGMPPEVAARIFEPFFTTKDVGQGTGLGLHIVRGEIDKHHGAIEVKSEPGQGTCFTIRLPIQNERLASEESQAASAPSAGRRVA